MGYEIRYLPLALEDIDGIAAYLSGFYPNTAKQVLDELEKAISRLTLTPEMYPEYEANPFYRKITTDKYLVFYHVNEEMHTADIYRILRASWDIERWIEQ